MKKLSLEVIILYTATFLLFVSCRKSDQTKINVSSQSASTNQVSNFFTIPTGTHPIVVSVAKELERRNNVKEFVSDFAKSKGFPVWNKAILNFSENNGINNIGINGGGGDSLI